MLPIRNLLSLLFVCLLAGIHQTYAQCNTDAVATNVTCFGSSNGSIDLSAFDGTAPYTYAWSNNQTTEDLANLAAGTYTCTTTDAVGCTTVRTVTVTEPPVLIVTTNDLTLNCFTPSGVLLATTTGGVPPYSYVWSNGSTTNPPAVSLPGAYAVTVTDANGCTAGSTAYVLMDVISPIACTGPVIVLTCAITAIQIDGSCSSMGPNFTYAWTSPNGNIAGGQSTLTPLVDAPGIYFLTVTNTVNGCTSTASQIVVEDVNNPVVTILSNLKIPCGGGAITLQANSVDGPTNTYLWTTIDGHIISGMFSTNPVVDEPGIYTLLVTNLLNGCTSTLQVLVMAENGGFCSKIKGRVLQDLSLNCQADAGEPPLSGCIVQAQGLGGTFYGTTDANGDYEIFVGSVGNYVVSAKAMSELWQACPAIPDILVSSPGETLVAADLLFQKLANCPLLSVNIGSGNLRRCFDTNSFNVSYCNIGTEPTGNAFVIVTLDPLFTVLNSSKPFIDLGGGNLRFQVGNLTEGQCGSFHFNAHLSCNAVFGQTHCTEAHIFPDDFCLPSDPQWSGASLHITKDCQPDSLRFTIQNLGVGNMNAPVNYRLFENLVLLQSAPIQLNAGASTNVSAPANGSTWRLEVEQVPFHPGHSAPSISVEGCTTNNTFSTGYVTQFPVDDADEFVDIDCKVNTASSDPNDKQAFPIGYGSSHYVRPGTPLEYQIRFQNTGNDTAFTVRVVDTLSAFLDPTSIRPGAGSHPYTWDLTSAGVLSFLFKDILLPDSNVNEAASHGFVKFTIEPRAEAPLESVIENTAHIYFDFNEAIVTNTTFHRLGEHFLTVGAWQPVQPNYAVRVTPNPVVDAAVLEVKGLEQGSLLRLQVFDLQGKLQIELESATNQFQIRKGNLPAGTYFFKINQDQSSLGNGKIILQNP